MKERIAIPIHNEVGELVLQASGKLTLVEGFFDCFRIWQAGFKNVVALMGSVLSPDQVGVIDLPSKGD
jgi:DNA primase